MSVLRLSLGPFVLDGPRGIAMLEPVVGRLKVDAVAGLVAQRPDDDRRVVLVASRPSAGCGPGGRPSSAGPWPATPGRSPCRATRCSPRRPGTARYLSQSSYQAGVVGIVARPHGVDVVLLHQLDVADHRLTRDVVSGVRVVLVAVDALEVDRLAVHQQLAVVDLDLAEADLTASGTSIARPSASLSVNSSV